jgi:hypothetical protein
VAAKTGAPASAQQTASTHARSAFAADGFDDAPVDARTRALAALTIGTFTLDLKHVHAQRANPADAEPDGMSRELIDACVLVLYTLACV